LELNHNSSLSCLQLHSSGVDNLHLYSNSQVGRGIMKVKLRLLAESKDVAQAREEVVVEAKGLSTMWPILLCLVEQALLLAPKLSHTGVKHHSSMWSLWLRSILPLQYMLPSLLHWINLQSFHR
jgi:hypothetical protein